MTTILLGSALLLLPNALPTDHHLEARLEQAARDRMSCGPRAVWFCLRRLGIHEDFKIICKKAKLQSDGSSLEDLVQVFQTYKVAARAIICDKDYLKNLPTPSILVIDHQHCIVLDELDYKNQTVRYYEPIERKYRTVSDRVLEQQFSGEVIILEPMALSYSLFFALAILTSALVLISGWFLPNLLYSSLGTWKRKQKDTILLSGNL